MNFFGSLLGQPTTTTTATLQRHETGPGELMESEQSSESSDDRVGLINEAEKKTSVVGKQDNNETAKYIKDASETISGWVSGVQAFVSHHVAEITDKVLVIPRHPKAHKSRATQKKWWSLSSYTKTS
jgi:hypothetical protein